MKRILTSLAAVCGLALSHVAPQQSTLASSSVTYTCRQAGYAVTPPSGWGQRADAHHQLTDAELRSFEQQACSRDLSLSFASRDQRARIALHAYTDSTHPANATLLQYFDSPSNHFAQKPGSYQHTVIHGVDWLVGSVATTGAGFNDRAYFIAAAAAVAGATYLFVGTVTTVNQHYAQQIAQVQDALASVRLSLQPKIATPPSSIGRSNQPSRSSQSPILNAAGNGNQQSQAFTASNTFQLAWKASPSAGFVVANFIVNLHDASGALIDVLVNYLGGPSSAAATVHHDCSSGCYVEVQSQMNWTLAISR